MTMPNNDNYFETKEQRAQTAKQHLADMGKYNDRTQDSIHGTIIYGGPDEAPVLPWSDKRINPEVTVEDADTVTAILKVPEGRTAVLNFASYKNPGGGFINGAMAQEEALCHESNLYNILSAFKFSYYAWNVNHINRSLYANRALYSPDVIFERDGNIKQADVITCAAPNYNAALKNHGMLREVNIEAMRERIEFIKCIAEKNNAENLILGAFGCGVFGQDPYQTAYLFKEVFARCSYIRRIIYAIPAGKNLEAFKKIFSERK